MPLMQALDCWLQNGLDTIVTSFLAAPGTALATPEDTIHSSSTSWDVPTRHPLLFQDVDGVLNTYRPFSPRLDEVKLHRLAHVVANTNADLVISSQWRKDPRHLQQLRQSLDAAGIPLGRIIGQTPALCGGVDCRAREIEAFLRSHPEVAWGSAAGNWTAVDDVDLAAQDSSLMRGHFVKTDPMEGLTEERAHALQQSLLAGPAASQLAPVSSLAHFL
eukprot:TRINITY_DN49224_c0_g1_i1.p1 TRINITY_DN49224_c0_g1~~TRINITY_DN49224_c0_g1_i1.p1  ORF type:complete len:218 (+),score=32.07 TRINITY_DN49224_c0_g1_i1:63-716(+)